MAENVTELIINTKTLKSGVRATKASFQKLIATAEDLESAFSEAFSVDGYKDYLKTVRRFGRELTDELLVMKLSFGSMKAAITDATAPIVALFVPMLNRAMEAVTEFAGYAGQFLRGLILGVTGQDMLGKSAESAAQSEEKLASSAKKAGSAVRRSLVSFDQLNRLNRGSGGGSSSTAQEDYGVYVPDAISPQVQQIVDQVLALLRPLMEIDLQPLRLALADLGDSFSQFAQLAAAGLEWLWFEVLTPFVAWVAERFAPAMVELFAAGLDTVTAALAPLMEGITLLKQALEPVIDFIGQQVLGAIDAWKSAFEGLTAMFQEKSPQITAIFQNVASIVTWAWNAISPILGAIGAGFRSTFDQVAGIVGTLAGAVIDTLAGISGFLAGVFSGDWQAAWDGIVEYLRGAVNAVIGLLNSMLSNFGAAVNGAIAGANSISLSIPEWVPVIGGMSYSPNLGYVEVPQIPYLAQGAVLPANRPFMAVVGDQRHGTNIEAPLSTIEEAVAGVMRDSIDSNMAGHEATVQVLRDILQAVLGIHIGDEAVAGAVGRYQQKMAIMRGV